MVLNLVYFMWGKDWPRPFLLSKLVVPVCKMPAVHSIQHDSFLPLLALGSEPSSSQIRAMCWAKLDLNNVSGILLRFPVNILEQLLDCKLLKGGHCVVFSAVSPIPGTVLIHNNSVNIKKLCPIRISAGFIVEIDILILKFAWIYMEHWIAKKSWKRRTK